MAKNDDGSRMLRCSFCGKTQDKVDKLIAGTGVCICNECVQLCNSVLEEEGLSSRRRSSREEAADITIPKPAQIKEVLELPDTDYTALADDFRADYTFMRDHAAAMSIVPGDRMDCLLITTEARNQGILMSQFRGKRYIKYIADLPKLGLDLAGVPVCREALVKLPRQPKKAKRLGKNQER